MGDPACPQCGYESSAAGARFCANCGAALPAGPGGATQINLTQTIGENTGNVTGIQIGKLVGTVIFGSEDAIQAQDRRNQRVLLQKVQKFWVEGVLKESLGGREPLHLEKRVDLQAVTNPLQELATAPKPIIDEGAPIEAAFESLDRAVLIMDGAGSGKTTTLLQLAQAAVEKASRDPGQPVPVVLHLGTWEREGGALSSWVLDELALRYQIPAEMGAAWLKGGRLALLLDGLEEVGQGRLEACIEAINEFRRTHGLVHLGICVRSDVYRAARKPLNLAGALELQAVPEERVRAYLAAVGESSASLMELLDQDADLRTLAARPLWLQVMLKAFDGQPVGILQNEKFDSGDERRSFLLERYLTQVFGQLPEGSISRERLRAWVGWLAGRMLEDHQGIFLLEQIQPSWLDGPGKLIYWLVSRGIVGLLIGVLLAGTAEVGGTPAGRLAYLVAGGFSGSLLGITAWLWSGRSSGSPARPAARAIWSFIQAALPAVAFWSVFRYWVFLGDEAWRLAGGAALVFGLLYGAAPLASDGGDIRPVEALAWSTRKAANGALPGMILLLVIVAGVAAIFASSNSLVVWLRFGLVYGAIGWFAVVLIAGLQGRAVEARWYPNQGVWMSWRNGAYAGLILGGVTGIGYALSGYGIPAGLVVAVRFGLLAALWFGARDGIHAGMLRLILTLMGKMPWNVVAWLEAASRTGIMQKVGGGYRFQSRLLQEYLAHDR